MTSNVLFCREEFGDRENAPVHFGFKFTAAFSRMSARVLVRHLLIRRDHPTLSRP